MSAPDYRWAAGLAVALNSLKNVATELYPYNYQDTLRDRAQVGIVSPILDAYPVRFVKGSGREGGGGILNHEWNLTITARAYKFIQDTYLSSGSAIDAAMTIYTRLHSVDGYGRYSCYLVLPSAAEGDIEYIRENVLRVRLRFRNLVAL